MSLSSVHQRILKLCLEIFEVNENVRNCMEKEQALSNQQSSRKIYPDTKYTDLIANRFERKQMTEAGERRRVSHCSELGKACYLGHYEHFKNMVNNLDDLLKAYKKEINFNIWLECESELSLLHLILFGRTDLVVDVSNDHVVVDETGIKWQFEHLKIAQFLLDHGLDVNIQNKWGYSALYESVINVPDLEYAQFLLDNKANPNQYCIFGCVPLLGCITQTQIESVKLLCENGADPRLLEYGHGITAISFSKHHIEIESIIYNTLNKIRNKNKSATKQKSEQELEYENASYCCVCGVTSKIKSLYLCSRCQGPKRYCSQKCQKCDWIKHKSFCQKNRRKIRGHEEEMIFKVITEQQFLSLLGGNNLCYVKQNIPTSLYRSNLLEKWSENNLNDRGMELPKHQKKYRKKRNKTWNKHKTNIKGKSIKLNYKFPIKIQIPLHKMDKKKHKFMYCYNKSRNFCVYIPNTGQKKKYIKLQKIIEKSAIAEKAYFYGYVDRKNRLHVITSKLLAMQPW